MNSCVQMGGIILSKVLLLDGDEETRDSLVAIFTSLGCDVEPCAHPYEALFAIDGDPPDLLLLSVPLKGSTPSSFLASLRSMENGESITIASLLAPGPEHDMTVSEPETLGIPEHLRKPVTHEEIRTLLSRVAKTQAPTRSDEPKNLFDKLRKDVSMTSIKSVLLHDLTRPDEQTSSEPANTAQLLETEAPPPAQEVVAAEEVVAPKPQLPEEPEIDGPKMVAYLEGEKHKMTIEVANSDVLVAWVGSERLTVGSKFGSELPYKDPAPGRNRMITLYLQLRVSSCVPAGERSFRATLKVEDVKPEERWNQFLRVFKADQEPEEED